LFCVECGSGFLPEARFCFRCGSKRPEVPAFDVEPKAPSTKIGTNKNAESQGAAHAKVWSCSCTANLKTGVYKRNQFRVCLDCRFIEWDSSLANDFICPVYEFSITVLDSALPDMSIRTFLGELEKKVHSSLGKRFQLDMNGVEDMNELSLEHSLPRQESLWISFHETIDLWELEVVSEMDDRDDLESMTSSGIFLESRLHLYSALEIANGAISDMHFTYEEAGKEKSKKLRETISALNFDGLELRIFAEVQQYTA
jgi:hypothetical protein